MLQFGHLMASTDAALSAALNSAHRHHRWKECPHRRVSALSESGPRSDWQTVQKEEVEDDRKFGLGILVARIRLPRSLA